MFCTDCGTKNSVDSKYCKECGAKINDGYRTMMLSLDDLRAIDDHKNQERLTKLLDMAFWHNEAGNLDASVLACEAALAIHPNSTTAHSLLGTLYEKRGNDAKAVEHLEAVVSLNPDSAADAAKLDQLRRGVHVKAVAPPPLSRWVPPALASLTVTGVKDKLTNATLSAVAAPPKGLKTGPFIAACAVAGIVLVALLLLIRPTAPARPSVVRTALVTPVAATPQAFSAVNPAPQAGNLAPVALRPSPATHTAVPIFGPDPFGDTPGTVAAPAAPLARTSRVPAVPRVKGLPRARPYGGRSVASLPPLPLRAVPLSGDGGVAPMPVSVPAIATVASMPQHTVVVSNLGGGRNTGGGFGSGSGGGYASGAYAGAPSPQSHIRISIHTSSNAENISLSDRDLPPSPDTAPSDTSGAGDSEQQTAIALQQQGDYRRAAAAYGRAIRAYQAQIASGRSTETAARALQACQTGLQICQQSH